MTDLIARLEAATADRELDKAIARQLGYRIAATTGEPHIMRRDNDFGSWRLPAYTASLDAALTLVPEGMIWKLGSPPNNHCLIGRPSPKGNFHNKGGKYVSYHAATPAIALCIAALKARQEGAQ